MRDQIFLSYHEEDSHYARELKKMLNPYKLDIWDESCLIGGENVEQEFKDNIEKARIAILIVSSDYLAADSTLKIVFDQVLAEGENQDLSIMWLKAKACLAEETELVRYKPVSETPLSSLKGNDLSEELALISGKIKRRFNGEETSTQEESELDVDVYKNVNLQFPIDYEEDKRKYSNLIDGIIIDIELKNYSAAIEKCNKAIDISPRTPHGHLYLAFLEFLSSDKNDIIRKSANPTIKRLKIAKDRFNENKEDYNKIADEIAKRYYQSINDRLNQIEELIAIAPEELVKDLRGILFKFTSEIYNCSNISSNKKYLERSLSLFYGYSSFGWYLILPPKEGFSSLESLIKNHEYKTIPKDYRVDEVVKKIKNKLGEDYDFPAIKYDCSKLIHGQRATLTIEELLKISPDKTSNIQAIQSKADSRLERANSISEESVLSKIQNNSIKEFDQLRVIANSSKRDFVLAASYENKIISRKEIKYQIYLTENHRRTVQSLFDISKFAPGNYMPSPKKLEFSNEEAIINETILETPLKIPIAIDKEKEVILDEQPDYIIPLEKEFEKCEVCDGKMYVECEHCEGKHATKCSNCLGFKNTTCTNCNGHRLIASDDGHNVSCTRCNGTGKETCHQCNGKGEFYCSYCNGDKKKPKTYGKIACKNCKATGKFGFVTMIKSEIQSNNTNVVIQNGEVLSEANRINARVQQNTSFPIQNENIYFNYNGRNNRYNTKHSRIISSAVQKHLGHKMEKYPMLLSEKLSFELLPIFTFKFKNILSQKTHEVSILNYDDKDYSLDVNIIFHDDIRANLKHESTFKNLINKAFSTKKYIEKLDLRNKLILMIYVAKADGIIEDREKEIIEDSMKDFGHFTKKEQNLVFDLLQKEQLDPINSLNSQYFIFSNDQVENKVKTTLSEIIGKADGNLEPEEEKLIDKISDLIDINRSKKQNQVVRFLSTWQISVLLLITLIIVILLLVNYA